MWFRPEQLPHFVREARIESFSYFRPVAAARRAMLSGRSSRAARRRQGGATAGETFLCSEDPVGLLVEECQRPLPRHSEGIGEPHGSRRPHADRDAPGPGRLREGYLPEPGMVDHLGGFGFYGDPAPGTPEIPSEPSEPSVPSDLFVSSAHSAPSGPFAFPFIPPLFAPPIIAATGNAPPER